VFISSNTIPFLAFSLSQIMFVKLEVWT